MVVEHGSNVCGQLTAESNLFIKLCKHANTVVFLWVVVEAHHAISLVYRCVDLAIFNLCKPHHKRTDHHCIG